MKVTKVCMITTRHLPSDPRIFERESKSLKNAGFDVSIVVEEAPLPQDNGGIHFIPFQKKQGIFRKIHTIFETYKAAKSADADIYHCHEIDASLIVGWLLKLWNRGKKIKLIFDCHEFWLAFFTHRVPRGFKTIFKKFFLLYEKFIVKRCDAVITANSIEKSYYQIKFPLKNIYTIYNVPHAVNTNVKNLNAAEKSYDLCFEGLLNFQRGLENLFLLIKKLKKNFDSHIKLLIIGEIESGKCKDWAENFIKEHNLQENILITGWQSYRSLYDYHIRSKIGILLYYYTPNNLLAGPPNKIFNYMRAGIPVVASKLPETKNIIEEVDCGILVNPHDLEEAERAVVMLLSDESMREEMGKRGYTAFTNKYNWEVEEKRLIRIYRELT